MTVLAASAAAAAPASGGEAAETPLVQAIDACLPQTQCGQCGHGGCLPYARAVAAGEAAINRCPPGGDAGIALLAGLLGQPRIALDPSCGAPRALHVAVIDESRCIGCTLCLQACPVDAIAGAPKLMHTVVAAECTGCDLCLAPCPVDCIEMRPVAPEREWTRADADAARRRLHERDRRLARERKRNDARLEAKALRKLVELDLHDAPPGLDAARKRAIVEAALERVRTRRSSFASGPHRGPADSADSADESSSRGPAK